jgi:membrane-associated HD superfamily phosphohydrolase
VARELSKRNFGEVASVDTGAFDLISKILFSFVKPNLIFNQGETEGTFGAGKGKILKTIGIVRENEKIISRHEIVTPEALFKT